MVIMGLISILALGTRFFGTDLFAIEFEAAILYLPTLVLLIAVLYEWRKTRGGPTIANLKSENKVL